jgi:hypothetical protein
MKHGSGGDAGAGYESEASPFQQPARRPFLQRVVPVAEHVRGYRGGTLRRDLVAGVTVAALALPASLAYAEIAGLSPVVGLYALLLPALAYAIFGSSRQVIVGPELYRWSRCGEIRWWRIALIRGFAEIVAGWWSLITRSRGG